jgi:alpha-1,3-rhamnosyl/mannosyltransferase
VLHVGAHDERKNTATLIAAFARAFPAGDVALAFTRRPPSLPAGSVVIDAPDDAALAALYRGAALVAVPSTYEGFGFPLLEAMACGAPVLAARAGALPEVGGDAAAWVDDAHDAAAWADALRALLGDEAARTALAARGPARAATFSWERCTAQTMAVLAEVAAP